MLGDGRLLDGAVFTKEGKVLLRKSAPAGPKERRSIHWVGSQSHRWRKQRPKETAQTDK